MRGPPPAGVAARRVGAPPAPRARRPPPAAAMTARGRVASIRARACGRGVLEGPSTPRPQGRGAPGLTRSMRTSVDVTGGGPQVRMERVRPGASAVHSRRGHTAGAEKPGRGPGVEHSTPPQPYSRRLSRWPTPSRSCDLPRRTKHPAVEMCTAASHSGPLAGLRGLTQRPSLPARQDSGRDSGRELATVLGGHDRGLWPERPACRLPSAGPQKVFCSKVGDRKRRESRPRCLGLKSVSTS